MRYLIIILVLIGSYFQIAAQEYVFDSVTVNQQPTLKCKFGSVIISTDIQQISIWCDEPSECIIIPYMQELPGYFNFIGGFLQITGKRILISYTSHTIEYFITDIIK